MGIMSAAAGAAAGAAGAAGLGAGLGAAIILGVDLVTEDILGLEGLGRGTSL